jgi:SAM-dependent methyltransferase
MADRWFEIASVDHFWIRRRFEVLQKLAPELIASAKEIAEVGCGPGLLQRQIEDACQREVTGFDLHEDALKHNVSRHSPVLCYDIFHSDAALRSKFDLIFLFDVLEHISDEAAFLKAILFHLADRGKIAVNVPAGQWAYSKYDEAVGHIRRYSINTLGSVAAATGLRVQAWTYWGFGLLPTLAIRKLWVSRGRDERAIISTGFDSGLGALNNLLLASSRFELIPQKFIGTSLMAILERA